MNSIKSINQNYTFQVELEQMEMDLDCSVDQALTSSDYHQISSFNHRKKEKSSFFFSFV